MKKLILLLSYSFLNERGKATKHIGVKWVFKNILTTWRQLYGKLELETSEAEIMSELKKRIPNKRRGCDTAPPILFKENCDVISASLKNLFSNIERTRKIPN